MIQQMKNKMNEFINVFKIKRYFINQLAFLLVYYVWKHL